MKKIMSAVLAGVISVLSVVPAVSSAAVLNDIEELDEKYIPVFSDWINVGDENASLYMSGDGTLYKGIHTSETAYLCQLSSPEMADFQLRMEYGEGVYLDYTLEPKLYKIELSDRNAREVCAFLEENELVKSFFKLTDVINLSRIDNDFDRQVSYRFTDNLESVLEYSESNGLDVKKFYDTDTGVLSAVTIQADTLESRLDIALDIYNATGVRPYGAARGDFYAYGAEDCEGIYSDVDVLNAVDGDANEDGKMTIADAAAVIQALGNPDKYALTAQGNFNADTDENGLTMLDALAIQKELANK